VRVYHRFSVVCVGCNHRNVPHRSPREGVRRVLAGEVTKCNGCKCDFTHIAVPGRPLVQSISKTLLNLSSLVSIVNYSGDVPPAMGHIV